jgi:hypothetical protein
MAQIARQLQVKSPEPAVELNWFSWAGNSNCKPRTDKAVSGYWLHPGRIVRPAAEQL